MNIFVFKSLSSDGTLKDHAFCPSEMDASKIKKILETDKKFCNKILFVSTIPLTTYKEYVDNKLAMMRKEKVIADKKLAQEIDNFRQKRKIQTE